MQLRNYYDVVTNSKMRRTIDTPNGKLTYEDNINYRDYGFVVLRLEMIMEKD